MNHSRDNFGLEVDGPVYIPHLYNGKDKTFFMLQWDQSYESSPSTSPTINSIPNPQWLTGNFAGATYWDSTTNSLMPLTIYDPLSPLVSFVDVDGKTKTRHKSVSRQCNSADVYPGRAPAIRYAAISIRVGAGLFQYYNGITPNYNPGPGYAPWQNNLYWIQVQTFTGRSGIFKLDQNFGAKDRGTLQLGEARRYKQHHQSQWHSSEQSGQRDFLPGSAQRDGLGPGRGSYLLAANLILDNKVVVNTPHVVAGVDSWNARQLPDFARLFCHPLSAMPLSTT